MQHDQNRSRGWLNVSADEIIELFSAKGNPEGTAKALLICVGLFFFPVSLFGALWFYRRAYNRFMRPSNEPPRFSNLKSIVKIAMVIGGVLAWVIVYAAIKLMVYFILYFGGNIMRYNPYLVLIVITVNIVFTYIGFFLFNKWRSGVKKSISEAHRHGTAMFAKNEDLAPYRRQRGLYIGKDLFYDRSGHGFIGASTRGGKMVNILGYNLLMPWLYKGKNLILLDPKGELAKISKRIQESEGRKTVVLNPWNLLDLGNTGYNPLDILQSDINLCDDVEMIAECIIPNSPSGQHSDHFDNRARAFLSGLLLHLVTSASPEDRHLGTLWQWLRLSNEDWISLLAEMMLNDDPNAGEIVRACANEIVALMKTSDKEYGSVISSAQKYTDFIKSPSLRKSMQGSDQFTVADLASGNVTIYLTISFDRLDSYSAWVKLVITTLMRSVVRDPKKEAIFFIDEAYKIGFHREILTAYGAYAGMGVSVWSVFQNLSQVQSVYGDSWQTLISNASFRSFFNIQDNFSAEYLEKMFGAASVPTYDDNGLLSGSTARPLVTADEIRRSGDIMYTVIDDLPVARIPKHPYYITNLDCDPNPYYKGNSNEATSNTPPMPSHTIRGERRIS